MRSRSLVRAALATAATVLLAAAQAAAVTVTVHDETTPYPGVRVQELRTTSPTTRAWAAFIDLCNDYVHVDATKASSSLRTAGAWGGSTGVQLAVNGDFYATGPMRVYGQAVGGGVPWPVPQTGTDPSYGSQWYYERYGWIAFGDNWVEFSHTELTKLNAASLGITQGWKPDEVTHSLPPGTKALVSGFPALVIEGNRVTCSSPTASSCFPDRTDMRARHPRSAMGLTADRRTFILVTVDGRTSLSSGMYGAELAELMDKLGAWQAFNLDGGGSTQMWTASGGYQNNATGNNGGGSVRAVANHWGVFAGTAGGKSRTPGHCVDYLVESVLNTAVNQSAATTDIDGDGIADACIRGPDGVHCVSGGAKGFGADQTLVGLSDSGGWGDLTNASTLRMGDIDGDGRADLCARANAGIRCWTSAKSALGTQVTGPDLSDASGWDGAAYYATLRLADFDGDGKDDLCARAAAGWRCYPSTGSGFAAAVTTSLFANADGFADPNQHGSVRMGDIDGDGKADVCIRASEGVQCHLSDGAGFPTAIGGPAWSDTSGWWRPRYWSTIRLVDVDGDGKADICARSSTDFRCHLSQGNGFGPAITKAILADASGWGDPSNYSTIRMADIDGDGDADLCARSNTRVTCWPWEGSGFGGAIQGPQMPDNDGWLVARLYAGLRLADVTGDGRADVCARDGAGLACWASNGTGFPTKRTVAPWAGLGWENPSVWGTLMIAGPRCTPSPETCNGKDDDCDGIIDDGCDADAGPPDSGAGGGMGLPGADSGLTGGTGGGSPNLTGDPSDDGGCACRATPHRGASWLGAATLAVLLLAGRRRRRGAGSVITRHEYPSGSG